MLDMTKRPERPLEPLALTDLIERYRTASEDEAPGLLHAAAHLWDTMPGPQNGDIIVFLRTVGSEARPPWEPNGYLRLKAREVLLRHIANRMFRDNVCSGVNEFSQALDCLTFFASDARYFQRISNQDRSLMHEFISRTWSYAKKVNQWELTIGIATSAAIKSRDFKFLLYGDIRHTAVRPLYEYLYDAIKRSGTFKACDYESLLPVGVVSVRPTDTQVMLLAQLVQKHAFELFEYADTLVTLAVRAPAQ